MGLRITYTKICDYCGYDSQEGYRALRFDPATWPIPNYSLEFHTVDRSTLICHRCWNDLRKKKD